MTYRGTVVGGVVVLEKALPEGTPVRVEPVKRARGRGKRALTLSEKLLSWAGRGIELPPDFAENHDHYLLGLPKR
jgi:hypothetical protein